MVKLLAGMLTLCAALGAAQWRIRIDTPPLALQTTAQAIETQVTAARTGRATTKLSGVEVIEQRVAADGGGASSWIYVILVEFADATEAADAYAALSGLSLPVGTVISKHLHPTDAEAALFAGWQGCVDDARTSFERKVF